MKGIFHYIDRPSVIHDLTGATKLVCLLLWSFAAMSTYDTRFLAALSVLGLVLFGVSKIHLEDVKFMLWFTIVFLFLNNFLVFVLSPQHGVNLYGTRHEIVTLFGNYVVTQEQLFYHLNLLLKYLATIPLVLLFLCTTHPSEFAASLNKIGLGAGPAYSVSLALRLIPDIQRQFHEISQAQQARGIEMSKKESLFRRLKAASTILVPLILSSMERIDIISNAMELRGFGKSRKRTWYMARPFTWKDYLAMGVCVAFLILSMALNVLNGGRFWNPFV